MPNKSNQEREWRYFEMFRKEKDCPLPVGTLDYGDKPDVILEGERKIGIEITNFFLEEGKLPESEQVQTKRREQVVSEAQCIYQTGNGKKIRLSFGFDKTNPIRDKNKLVKEIVELARRIEESETGEIKKDIFRGIAELSFVYLDTKEYENSKWGIYQLHETPYMSTEKLREIVKAKEAKSTEYKRCDAYWLLIVVEFFDPAQDQEILINGFEKVDSEIFEKILIYKAHFGDILEVK